MADGDADIIRNLFALTLSFSKRVIFHDDLSTWKCFQHYLFFERKFHRLPVDFPQRGSVMRSFGIFYVTLNQLLNKKLSCQWFETLWRLCDVIVLTIDTAQFAAMARCWGFCVRSRSDLHVCSSFIACVQYDVILDHFIARHDCTYLNRFVCDLGRYTRVNPFSIWLDYLHLCFTSYHQNKQDQCGATFSLMG